jgi:hypothetical protein
MQVRRRMDMRGKVFDRDFKYVPARETDIRKTFKRERKRLAAESKTRSAVVHVLEPKRQDQA